MCPGYFCRDSRGRVVSTQRGVMRTNCMDCLDRTNVVQSIIARQSLVDQLMAAGAQLQPNASTSVLAMPFEGKLVKCFRALWGSNADAISVLYAGTPALKGDFTRTGKRTRRGMLADGLNSAKRYVINNFIDEINQAAVEAMLGMGVLLGSPTTATSDVAQECSAIEPDISPTEARSWIKSFEQGRIGTNSNSTGSSHNVTSSRGSDDAFWFQPLTALIGPSASPSTLEEEESVEVTGDFYEVKDDFPELEG